jgi:hypothetical protein
LRAGCYIPLRVFHADDGMLLLLLPPPSPSPVDSMQAGNSTDAQKQQREHARA